MRATRLGVDFASPSKGTSRPLSVAVPLLITAFVVYGALVLWRQIDRPVDSPKVPARQIHQPALVRQEVPERVSREISVPWGHFFGGIEDAAKDGVVLFGLEATGTDGLATLDAEAIDLSALASYVARLRAVGLEHVRIVRQQPVLGGERVRFSMSITWISVTTNPPRTKSLSVFALPSPLEVAALSTEWLANAKVIGLSVRGVDHEWSQDQDSTRFATLTFDVSGDYTAAREFVNRAVESRSGIALHQFDLKAREGETQSRGVALQGRLVLRVFVREQM